MLITEQRLIGVVVQLNETRPHHNNIGERFASTQLIIVRSVGDHDSGVPIGVAAQSLARISASILCERGAGEAVQNTPVGSRAS
jgi:hypothetical protein